MKCVDKLLGEVAEPPEFAAASKPELDHQGDDLAS